MKQALFIFFMQYLILGIVIVFICLLLGGKFILLYPLAQIIFLSGLGIGFVIFSIVYILFRFWHLHATLWANLSGFLPVFFIFFSSLVNWKSADITLTLSLIITFILYYIFLWRFIKIKSYNM